MNPTRGRTASIPSSVRQPLPVLRLLQRSVARLLAPLRPVHPLSSAAVPAEPRDDARSDRPAARILLTWAALILLTPFAFAQPTTPGADKAPARVDADQAWSDLVTFLGTPRQTPGEALDAANRARSFYQTFPNSARASEARRFEALSLIDAADTGDTGAADRMKATVEAIRADASMPAFERAVVIGTFEFRQAGKRAKKPADLLPAFEAVSHQLIKDFPDQPQGFISLLTQAQLHEPAATRAMAAEVLAAPQAPAAAKTRAQRLITRLDLVGQPADALLVPALEDGGKRSWQRNRPGLVYFWATWSPDSLAFGKWLAGRKLARANVVGICLDRSHDGLPAIAAAQPLPGAQILLFQGLEDDLAVRLGADTAPLLYLVDARGRFTDVRGLDDIEAKLAALGL